MLRTAGINVFSDSFSKAIDRLMFEAQTSEQWGHHEKLTFSINSWLDDIYFATAKEVSSGRASGHQNLVSISSGIDNCLKAKLKRAILAWTPPGLTRSVLRRCRLWPGAAFYCWLLSRVCWHMGLRYGQSGEDGADDGELDKGSVAEERKCSVDSVAYLGVRGWRQLISRPYSKSYFS